MGAFRLPLSRPRGTLLVALSFVLAVLASGAWLVVPAYTGVSASQAVAPGGTSVQGISEVRHATLLEVNGPRVLPILAIPVVLAAIPLAVNWTRSTRLRTAVRTVTALLLTTFAVVTGFSIGLFYLPTAGGMIAAALWGATAPNERRQ